MFKSSLIVVVLLGNSNVVMGGKLYNSYTPLILQANATNQCTQSDQEIWQSSSSDSSSFYDSIQSCTQQNAASDDMTNSVSQCISTSYPGLSQSCAHCFGADVDCGATNCRGTCQVLASQSCQTCLSPCTEVLAQCTGTTDLPSNTTSTTTKSGLVNHMIGSAAFVVMMHVVFV